MPSACHEFIQQCRHLAVARSSEVESFNDGNVVSLQGQDQSPDGSEEVKPDAQSALEQSQPVGDSEAIQVVNLSDLSSEEEEGSPTGDAVRVDVRVNGEIATEIEASAEVAAESAEAAAKASAEAGAEAASAAAEAIAQEEADAAEMEVVRVTDEQDAKQETEKAARLKAEQAEEAARSQAEEARKVAEQEAAIEAAISQDALYGEISGLIGASGGNTEPGDSAFAELEAMMNGDIDLGAALPVQAAATNVAAPAVELADQTEAVETKERALEESSVDNVEPVHSGAEAQPATNSIDAHEDDSTAVDEADSTAASRDSEAELQAKLDADPLYGELSEMVKSGPASSSIDNSFAELAAMMDGNVDHTSTTNSINQDVEDERLAAEAAAAEVATAARLAEEERLAEAARVTAEKEKAQTARIAEAERLAAEKAATDAEAARIAEAEGLAAEKAA
eukprot:COSAG01_NODE_1478_length_10164_cov_66.361550_1_plen_451_part_10